MNIFQQSIARTRAKMHEAKRLAGVALRDIKADRAQTQTNLELLLDHIVAETGLELTPANMPTIVAYVSGFIEDQQRNKEDAFGDVGGMRDFPI
jgi:hypothetical protein